MNFLQRQNRNYHLKFISFATVLTTILIFTKFQPTNASVSIIYADRLNNSLKTISHQLVINTSLLENDLNYKGTFKINIIPIFDTFILPFFKNKNMNISLVTAGKTNNNGHLLYSQAVTWRLKNDTYFTMSFGRTLIRNTNYEIKIHFYGKFADNTYNGYYASSYVSKNNEKSWYTLTENSIDRNQCAFPCSNEINVINNLQLILGHHKNVSAISNVGNSYVVSEDNEFIQERFSYPFNIPYHAVAFSINNFSNITMEKVAIWSTLDSKQYLNYALNIGSKLLKFYETIFQHEYEINKCNIIAVPNTVNYITEHYGLIKIQEDFLFYVEHISSDSKKAEVSLLMGHILGNAYMIPLSYLISGMVKEDIVTYFKYSLIDRFDSSLQITNQYGILELQRILEIDATYHHTNANMIDDRKFHLMNEHIIIADLLSYTKNAAVLRMFESLLKAERFHQSLTEFFLINRLTNAENRLTEYFEKLSVHLNDDLKFELNQRSSTINTKEFNVTKILQKWFQQKGYPIVHVKIDDNQIIFEQEKFNYYSFDYSLYIDDDDDYTDDNNSNLNNITWWIPISFTTSYELNFKEIFPKYWLPFKSQIAYPLMLHENDWYLLNLYRTGFYRVNYDIKNWKYLINLLNTRLNINMIPSPIRSQLIDDSLNLARANYIPYALAFNLTNYLENEIEYIPWKSALYCFDFIRAMLDTLENENFNFETYVSFLMKKIYLKINMKNINNNDYIERQHDFDILRSACDYGVSDCALTSVAMLGHWRTKSKPDINNPIPKLLKPIIYCASIKYGTESEWKFIFRRFQIMSEYNDEKKILLLSLGCSRDEEILTNFLNTITYGNEQFYNLYKTLIFNYISKTSFGRKVIVNFLKNETDKNKIKTGFTSTSDYIEVLRILFQRMNTLTEHIHVKKIMSVITNRNDIKILEKSVKISAKNIRWMDRFGDIIKDLAKNNLNRLMKTNRTLV